MKYFNLISGESIAPDSKHKVLPRNQFSKLLSAQEIINKAQKELAEHKEAIEEQGRAATERGYRDGFERGLHEFNEHLLHLNAVMREARLDLQNQVLPLALKAAKKIVGEAFALDPDLIVTIVQQALKSAYEAKRVKIWVSKEDKQLLENKKDELRKILNHVELLVVEERSDVTEGGCIIETEYGIINASWENQWRALEAAFNKLSK